MKKIKVFIMIMVMLTSAYASGVSASDGQMLYAPDGRSFVADPSEVASYVNVGWYAYPVTTLYSLDDRELVVASEEVDAYINVGWYREPVIIMYAPDGRTYVANKADAPTYKSVGWYYEPVQTMYAADGREMVVPTSQIGAYQNVGWYLPEDYIIILADYLCGQSRYNEAVIAISSFTEPGGKWYVEDYAQRAKIKNKLNLVYYEWLTEVGAPLGVVDWYMSRDDNGNPKVNIELRNLTDKTIVAFEAEWTCYDQNGQIATDYPDLHNGIVSGWADGKELLPGSSEVYTWTLTPNSQTASISWPYPKNAAFIDGTLWRR